MNTQTTIIVVRPSLPQCFLAVPEPSQVQKLTISKDDKQDLWKVTAELKDNREGVLQ